MISILDFIFKISASFSIFTTSDGGSNWDSRDFNLPDMPIRSSILHPNSSNHALIATEIGVWETNNLFQNNTYWYPHNNLANVRVDMLNIRNSDNLVLASTHGRGQFYGYYMIGESLIGDINFDNDVNIIDVIALVNIILSNNECYECDLNNDDLINILDIISLVNIILNK